MLCVNFISIKLKKNKGQNLKSRQKKKWHITYRRTIKIKADLLEMMERWTKMEKDTESTERKNKLNTDFCTFQKIRMNSKALKAGTQMTCEYGSIIHNTQKIPKKVETQISIIEWMDEQM